MTRRTYVFHFRGIPTQHNQPIYHPSRPLSYLPPTSIHRFRPTHPPVSNPTSRIAFKRRDLSHSPSPHSPNPPPRTLEHANPRAIISPFILCAGRDPGARVQDLHRCRSQHCLFEVVNGVASRFSGKERYSCFLHKSCETSSSSKRKILIWKGTYAALWMWHHGQNTAVCRSQTGDTGRAAIRVRRIGHRWS